MVSPVTIAGSCWSETARYHSVSLSTGKSPPLLSGQQRVEMRVSDKLDYLYDLLDKNTGTEQGQYYCRKRENG